MSEHRPQEKRDMRVAPTKQFFVQKAPSIHEAISARDTAEQRELTFTYLDGPRGQEIKKDIKGVCLGVRQASEHDEASYWIFLKTPDGHILITYNPLDVSLQQRPFTPEQWSELMAQTNFHE